MKDHARHGGDQVLVEQAPCGFALQSGVVDTAPFVARQHKLHPKIAQTAKPIVKQNAVLVHTQLSAPDAEGRCQGGRA